MKGRLFFLGSFDPKSPPLARHAGDVSESAPRKPSPSPLYPLRRNHENSFFPLSHPRSHSLGG